MALADKSYTRMFSTDSRDDDYISSSDRTEMQNKFSNNEYILDKNALNMFGPLLYQLQEMQAELDELRRYLSAEVGDGAQGPAGADGRDGTNGTNGTNGTTPTITDLDGGNLPTSSRGLSSGDLYNDRGTVKVA